jgi:uncharacterized protein YmfQ (DUF2313 family)
MTIYNPTNPAASLGQPDFLRLLQALLPPGACWSTDPNANITALLNALADQRAGVHASAGVFSEVESDPAQTQQLLPEWENDYGLPDPCMPSGAPVATRQALLLAKIAQTGGQSRQYFIGLAAILGYTITITEFQPTRCGHFRAGDHLVAFEMRFVWRVTITAVAPTLLNPGTVLQCIFNRIRPPQTQIQFVDQT